MNSNCLTHRLETGVPLVPDDDKENQVLAPIARTSRRTRNDYTLLVDKEMLLYGFAGGITMQLSLFGFLQLVTIMQANGDAAKMTEILADRSVFWIDVLLCGMFTSGVYSLYLKLLGFSCCLTSGENEATEGLEHSFASGIMVSKASITLLFKMLRRIKHIITHIQSIYERLAGSHYYSFQIVFLVSTKSFFSSIWFYIFGES